MTAPPPASSTTTSDATQPGGRNATVLVVISDEQVRTRATSALGLRRDLDVTAVSTIAEARDLVGEADVLVVDGDLRPKGGYSWLYELHEGGELSGTAPPASLVLTDRPDDRFMVEWSRADAWLSKPVDPFTLAKTVAELATT